MDSKCFDFCLKIAILRVLFCWINDKHRFSEVLFAVSESVMQLVDQCYMVLRKIM